MAIERITTQVFGVAGASTAVNTTVAQMTALPPGRYKITIRGWHTLADGLKFFATDMSGAVTITQQPLVVAKFGPIVMDFVKPANTLLVQLAKATGVGEEASANIIAQRINL